MTKTEAILELLRDARTERSSRTSYKRICRALAVLDTEKEMDIVRILQWLEYHDGDGKPYPFCAERAT